LLQSSSPITKLCSSAQIAGQAAVSSHLPAHAVADIQWCNSLSRKQHRTALLIEIAILN
jgi:hypothetical protein